MHSIYNRLIEAVGIENFSTGQGAKNPWTRRKLIFLVTS